ncbi:zinc finger protein 4-like [Malania oleifera]|uniref:zinc finger protein 4-like n=1 Tax=Malania oleifera TaxID=397392 RepID=UPI0025AEA855|nr:zinc finger protein 4-like [Malania oleifera]
MATQGREPANGMNISDNSDEAIVDKSGEWLNLSLGRNSPSTAGCSSSQSRPASTKVFSCNFCMRKFYSSQALGGHQNAHKRERGATRRYQSQRMMAAMNLPISTPLIRSLGVRPHSLVKKPSGEGTVTARFNDANTGLAMPRMLFTSDETMDSIWPGSFHLDPQLPEQPPEMHTLDLNLRL